VIRHQPVGSKEEVTTTGWLPDAQIVVGLTSGASTPDNLVDQVIRRLESFVTCDS
jgi:4-hydroxy-3-methylbut-2-enyl diphosphate reductase